MSWDKDKILLFIEKYRKHTILWDPRDPQHFNRFVRQDAWAKLADEMEISVGMCQNKVTSLLASLRREKAKMKRKGIEKGAEQEYNSTWFAYKPLSFVLERYAPRITSDTITTSETETEPQDESTKIIKLEESDMPPMPKKQKVHEPDETVQPTFEILETRSESDECVSFGKFITDKLKTYSQNTRACVQYHIADILFSADRGEYEHMYDRESQLLLDRASTSQAADAPQRTPASESGPSCLTDDTDVSFVPPPEGFNDS